MSYECYIAVKHLLFQSVEECFCGNNTNYNRYGKVGDGECNHQCPGNKSENCGAHWRLSVYHSGK